ncbi:hypothetical protein Bca4012_079571 [Brassica carinata]
MSLWQSLSRANRPRNGIDFKPSCGNPTRLYTNGRTIADIVGEKLGKPNYAVPYLAPNASGDVLLKCYWKRICKSCSFICSILCHVRLVGRKKSC